MSFSIEENLMLHIRYYKENCSQKWTFLFARLISCHISIANCLQPTISTWSGFSLLCPPSCSEHKPFVVANIFSKPPLSLSFSLADTILPLPVWYFIPVQGYLPGLLYFECILYVTEFIRRQHVQAYPFSILAGITWNGQIALSMKNKALGGNGLLKNSFIVFISKTLLFKRCRKDHF